MKPRSFSIQSPGLQPMLLLESPAMLPHPTPLTPVLDESSVLYRRKLSEASERMEDGRKNTDDMMMGGFPYPQRKDSAFSLNGDKDKDGFRLPARQDRPDEKSSTRLPMSPAAALFSPKSPIPSAFHSPSSARLAPTPGQSRSPFISSIFADPGKSVRPSPLMLYSPYMSRTPGSPGSLMQMGQNNPFQGGFRLDGPVSLPVPAQLQNGGSIAEPKKAETPSTPEKMIGTLTVHQHREKIRKYLEKRKRRIWKKKICYDCRKKVADKRLRVKGRFVTKEQAYALLGTTAEDLCKNELLRKYANTNCSIVTLARNMKVRNIQTLLLSAEKQKGEKAKKEENAPVPEKQEAISAILAKPEGPNAPGHEERQGVKVELLRENDHDQTVEVRIESLFQKSPEKPRTLTSGGLFPKVSDPVFAFTKIKGEELSAEHKQYHIESA